MKKITFLLLVLILGFCKANPVQMSLNNSPKEYLKEEIQIVFSKDIKLKWDIAKSRFVKDSYYENIKNNRELIKKLFNSITDTTDLKIKTDTKTNTLKKGDIAFLYLNETGEIQLYKCLKIQFDILDKSRIPYGLLDYLETNRVEVAKKAKECHQSKKG